MKLSDRKISCNCFQTVSDSCIMKRCSLVVYIFSPFLDARINANVQIIHSICMRHIVRCNRVISERCFLICRIRFEIIEQRKPRDTLEQNRRQTQKWLNLDRIFSTNGKHVRAFDTEETYIFRYTHTRDAQVHAYIRHTKWTHVDIF